ncbi:MAG: RsmD family RNA methyltransferase [Candidatus Nanoarchaeia archaeon]|nr:RsmD family RNA methyltransferase [Candidatus Nanoarchaeia archaeon]
MNIKTILKDMLNDKELSELGRSFDTVGEIMILSTQKSISKKEKKIGEVILGHYKNIKVVAKWKGKTKGKTRIRKVEVISGDKRTETIHKENNCRFKLDINKTYFSPRLVSERERIYKKVKKGEIIVDMFAGVGAFSVECAKNSNPKLIYSVDINRSAFKYLKENIKINKVEDKVIPILGNAKKITSELRKKGVKADRIIMNLPESSENFLKDALKISKNGTMIHFYHFLDSSDMYSKAENWIKSLKAKAKIISKKTCGQRKPYEYRTCIDFKVESDD